MKDLKEEFRKKFVWNMTTDDHDVVAHYNEEDRELEFWNDYKIFDWFISKFQAREDELIQAIEGMDTYGTKEIGGKVVFKRDILAIINSNKLK